MTTMKLPAFLVLVLLLPLAASSFSAKPLALMGNTLRGGGVATHHQNGVVLSVTSAPADVELDDSVAGDSIVNSSIAFAELDGNITGVVQTNHNYYNWREFLPKGTGFGGVWKKFRWLMTGVTGDVKQDDVKTTQNFQLLARLLILLRAYERKFGVPEVAGPQEQRKLLADIVMDLYSSGTPTWVLETVMERVAEGLTGRQGVEFLLLPRRCFIYYPAISSKTPGTDMFKISPGYDIARMGAVEQVAVRLASFASNTKTVERLNPDAFRMPNKNELMQVKQNVTSTVIDILSKENPSSEELAEEILNLASSTYGLFFFLNSPRFQAAINATDSDDVFWEVKDSTRETFTRLAAHAASKSMDKIHNDRKELYSKSYLRLCRFMSSAGACGLWFGGSVPDMLVAGVLGLMVNYIGTVKALAFEERALTEVVASFFVGLSAGLLAIRWPSTFCFGAIAVASVMDFMQGFKVVYAVIETMSKNIVTGAARLLEGILFTGLVSYSIKFGLNFAFRLAGLPVDYSGVAMLGAGIGDKFFPLMLPFAATAWATLFWPSHAEVPYMAFHTILAFTLNWAGMPTFFAAMCVTFSAGLLSRFTGKGALGNTLAGLYALVPGTYMVQALLNTSRVGFIENVLTAAATIGIGGWAGTLLCSPTILGKTSGLHGWSRGRKEKDRPERHSLLYF